MSNLSKNRINVILPAADITAINTSIATILSKVPANTTLTDEQRLGYNAIDVANKVFAEAPDKEADLNQAITISAEDINEPAIYNWYDNEGNLIYQGKDLQVANAVAEKYKLEVIATADGFKDYKEVEVKLKPSTLENIAPNPATNNVLVSYKLNGVSSAYLMVIGYYGSNGTSNNYILDVNSNETNLNVSNYASGFYTVALVVNGEITDAKTLIKQ